MELLAQKEKPDVILLQETWSNGTQNPNILRYDYDIFYHNRETRRGGGVAMLINKRFEAIEAYDYSISRSEFR